MTDANESTADLFGLNEQPPAGRTAGLASLARRSVPEQQPPTPTQPDGSTGHLAVAPIDPADVTGTPEERLAAYEAALDHAEATAGEGLRRVKARQIIETGTVLRAIHDDAELLPALGMDWKSFITERRQMSLRRAYQYMDAAPALLRVWTCKILHAPPNESQALVLNAIIETHGVQAALQTAEEVQRSGGKPTAAALTAAGRKLGYVDPKQEQGENKGSTDGKSDSTPTQRLEAALKALHEAWQAIPPATVNQALTDEPERAEDLLAQIEQSANRTAKRARHRPK